MEGTTIDAQIMIASHPIQIVDDRNTIHILPMIGDMTIGMTMKGVVEDHQSASMVDGIVPSALIVIEQDGDVTTAGEKMKTADADMIDGGIIAKKMRCNY